LPNTVSSVYVLFIAIARLPHGLDSVERESSVGDFLLRLRLLTFLSISHSQSLSGLYSLFQAFRLVLSLPDFATLYSLILHLTVLSTEPVATFSVDPYRQSPAKGGPYNHDGVPKIT